MTNKKRIYIVGLVWGFIFFFWWLNGFLYNNWVFRFYSPKAWRYLFNEFGQGWRLSSTSDWIFFTTLFLSIPFFLWGWSLCLKVQWFKLASKIFHKILYFFNRKKVTKVVKKKIKIAATKGATKTRPQPLQTVIKQTSKVQQMPSGNIKKEEINPIIAPTKEEDKTSKNPFKSESPKIKMPSKAPAPPKEEVPFFLREDVQEMPLEEVEIPKKEVEKENLPELIVKSGYEKVDLEIEGLSFAAVAKEKLILFSVDEEKGDWLADEEEFNGEEPLWFSENFHRVSPIYKLIKNQKLVQQCLEKKGLHYQIIPCLIEKKGIIINVEDMKLTWDDLKVLVCRTDEGGGEELPLFAQILPFAQEKISKADKEILLEALNEIKKK